MADYVKTLSKLVQTRISAITQRYNAVMLYDCEGNRDQLLLSSARTTVMK